jgi:hypothetical protein
LSVIESVIETIYSPHPNMNVSLSCFPLPLEGSSRDPKGKNAGCIFTCEGKEWGKTSEFFVPSPKSLNFASFDARCVMFDA